MNKNEINAKLQYVFEGLVMSKEQKQILGDIIVELIDKVEQAGSSESVFKTATTSEAGVVKQAATIAALEGTEEITEVITTFNTLLSNLKSAGIMA